MSLVCLKKNLSKYVCWNIWKIFALEHLEVYATKYFPKKNIIKQPYNEKRGINQCRWNQIQTHWWTPNF